MFMRSQTKAYYLEARKALVVGGKNIKRALEMYGHCERWFRMKKTLCRSERTLALPSRSSSSVQVRSSDRKSFEILALVLSLSY